MSKKLFVVSDVHGHYTALMNTLDVVGFDKHNPNHIFVSCGDLFDRGKENHLVFDYVNDLQHKLLLKGNHEDMLCQVLKRGSVLIENIWNGIDITVSQLLGEDAVDINGHFDISAHEEKINEIMSLINSMLDYFETEKYIFVHGWLPIVVNERHPYIKQDWRNSSSSEWEEARLLEWQQLYDAGAVIGGKTIVCGHRPARLGYMFDSFREPDCSKPFYGSGIIAIDAGTVRSGSVNVLVVEDNVFIQ